MSEPIESVDYTLQNYAMKGTPTKGAVPGFEGVDSDTMVENNVGALQDEHPKFMKKFYEGIIQTINKQSRKSEKRIKEMNRESRKYT